MQRTIWQIDDRWLALEFVVFLIKYVKSITCCDETLKGLVDRMRPVSLHPAAVQLRLAIGVSSYYFDLLRFPALDDEL